MNGLIAVPFVSMIVCAAGAFAAPPALSFGDTTVTVTRADPKPWLAGYPFALSEVKGSLVAITMKFEAKIVSLHYAIDYRDAAKSDVALLCGSRRINPAKFAIYDLNKRRTVVETPGGYLQKDGRMGSLIMQPDELTLTFFFDVSADCAGEKLSLHLLFDDEHALSADVGAAP